MVGAERPVMAITGGASGIGYATATQWIQTGGAVVLMDLDSIALDAAVKVLGQYSRAVVTDVTSSESVDSAFDSIADIERRLDAVIACAGNTGPGPSALVSDEQFQRVTEVHLAGTFRTLCAAHGLLKKAEAGGSIVTISSVAGRVGMPQRASYNAVKYGIEGLTKSLAVEWTLDGIRVNSVAPGYVWTPLNQKLESNGQIDTSAIRARIPVGRWAIPEEIAKPIIFLASTAASYINGHTLYVDGGMTIAGDWYPTKEDVNVPNIL